VDEVNEELENKVKLDKARDTLLYGRGAKIDSMTLVSLIVAVEDALRREHGLSVTLANEKAMSMERSPFKTLGSMIDYVTDVVREAQKE
jgi:acyl carrier protein